MSRFVRDYFRKADELAQNGQAFVVFTWTKSLGHAPQELGAKAIVTKDGLHWGTIGGGKVEAKAITLGQDILSRANSGLDKAPKLLAWDLQRDVGMSCGGSVEMMMEIFPAVAWRVVVFGAGHVGQALIPALSLLDCHVTVVDTRAEWLAKLPPENDRLQKIERDHYVDYAPFVAEGSYCVLVTKGHANDVPILKCLLKRVDLKYLGVIGSTVKARKLKAELLQDGFAPETVSTFRCPMGIGFKSHEPGEIAFSIIAELLMVKNGEHARLRKSDKAAL